MKLSVFLCALLSPVFSMAASGAVYQATTLAPKEFRTISVDWVVMGRGEEHSLRGDHLDIGSSNALFNGQYQVLNIQFNNRDSYYYYTGEKVLVNNWDSGCGYGYRATATVISREPITGMSPRFQDDLKIRVKILDTNDTCHSNPSVQMIEYKLIKKYQP